MDLVSESDSADRNTHRRFLQSWVPKPRYDSILLEYSRVWSPDRTVLGSRAFFAEALYLASPGAGPRPTNSRGSLSLCLASLDDSTWEVPPLLISGWDRLRFIKEQPSSEASTVASRVSGCRPVVGYGTRPTRGSRVAPIMHRRSCFPWVPEVSLHIKRHLATASRWPISRRQSDS